MLVGIFIGAAAAFAAAALSAACYIKGKRDGQKQISKNGFSEQEEQSALMKKYEAIMGYDPYGERV